jgi:hypothetical protein
MQHPLHTPIAMITGFATVTVPTGMDVLFSANTAAELLLFACKGIIGGLISVGITRGVDAWKQRRNNNKQQHETNL